MNITFLLTQDLESSLGLGRYFPLAEELTKIGYQVNILALHPNLSGLSQRRIKKDGVQVHYVGQMHIRKVRGQKTYFNDVTLLRVALASTLRMAGNSFNFSKTTIWLTDPYYAGARRQAGDYHRCGGSSRGSQE